MSLWASARPQLWGGWRGSQALREWPGGQAAPGQLHRQLVGEGVSRQSREGCLAGQDGQQAFPGVGGSLIQGNFHVQLLSALGWDGQGHFQESLGLQTVKAESCCLKRREKDKALLAGWPLISSFHSAGAPYRRLSSPSYQLCLPSPQCPLVLNQLL